MQTCKKCYIPMTGIMSFSKDKHEKFCRCPKCRSETKHIPIKEIDFKEILNREYQKYR